MPDFAPNFTCRIRIKYVALGRIHTQQWRTPAIGGGGAGAAAAVAQIQLFYDAIAGDLYDDWAVLSTSVAAENSDIFLPFIGPTVTGGLAQPAGSSLKRAQCQSLSFTGRSASGNRAVFFVYGYGGANLFDGADNAAADFRLTTAENATLDAAITVLNTSPALVANDDEVVLYNQYANLKYNDYWEKRTRSGA